MAPKRSTRPSNLPLNTVLTDDLFEELSELTGSRVVYGKVWPDRLGDALADNAGDVDASAEFDLDVYLADGVYFELYGTLLFAGLDTLPIQGTTSASDTVRGEVQVGVWLEEIAADDEEQLVLVLGRRQRPVLYLVASGWVLEEWEELPEE